MVRYLLYLYNRRHLAEVQYQIQFKYNNNSPVTNYMIILDILSFLDFPCLSVLNSLAFIEYRDSITRVAYSTSNGESCPQTP